MVFLGTLKSINNQFYPVLVFGQSPGRNGVNHSSSDIKNKVNPCVVFAL